MSQLPILYVVSLLMDLSVAGVTFAISRRAAELGASASQLGWLGAVWIGVYAMLALLTGPVLRPYGSPQTGDHRLLYRREAWRSCVH